MSFALTVLAGIVAGVLLIGGVLRIALWVSDRNATSGSGAWHESGQHYGQEHQNTGFTSGGDAGCGGGD